MSYRSALSLTALLLAIGCGSGSDAPPTETSDPLLVPDFLLEDLNDTSPSYGLDVSPREYIGNLSAWYFGEAT